MRVAVQVGFACDEEIALLEISDDLVGHIPGAPAGQPIETGQVFSVFTQRSHNGQAELLAQLVIVPSAAGSDVNDPRTLGFGHHVPLDDPMSCRRFGSSREMIERAVVGPTQQRLAVEFFDDLEPAATLERC